MRIRRGADKPDRKPFKTPPCVTRLVVEEGQFDNTAFALTVFNSGNLPSYHVRINIYVVPVGGEPEDGPLLVATGSTTLGILERKQVSVIKQLGGISAVNRYYAVVFDPINDPFPVGRVRQLYLQEINLLAPSLWYSLPGWKQYRFNDDQFHFDEAEAVPDDERTWQLNPVSELEDDGLPANPRITEVLFPHKTPSDHSEFRYRVDIDNPFFLSEIGKGNVTVHSSCMLYTFDQRPRDRGGFWLRQSRLQNGNESPLVLAEPPLTSPDSWIKQEGRIDADTRLTTITVRLMAKRRKGQENNAYFGNVHCALKHRQVKVLRASDA
jgi:hypothetical protein